MDELPLTTLRYGRSEHVVDGAMAADPTVPGKPTSACDGLANCEILVDSLIQLPGI